MPNEDITWDLEVHALHDPGLVVPNLAYISDRQARPGVFVALRPFGEDSENVDPALLFESGATASRRNNEFSGDVAGVVRAGSPQYETRGRGRKPPAVLRELRGAPVLAPQQTPEPIPCEGARPRFPHRHQPRTPPRGAVARPAHLGCPHLGQTSSIQRTSIASLAWQSASSRRSVRLALTSPRENPQDVFRVAGARREAIASHIARACLLALPTSGWSGLSEDEARSRISVAKVFPHAHA